MKKLKEYPKEFQVWLEINLTKIYRNYKEETSKIDCTKIVEKYHNQIHPLRKKNNKLYITDQAKSKIKTRLREFSEDELLQAIDNFSGANWWMENNSKRGVQWFFHSEDRIEQFLNLVSKEVEDPSISKLRNLNAKK